MNNSMDVLKKLEKYDLIFVKIVSPFITSNGFYCYLHYPELIIKNGFLVLELESNDGPGYTININVKFISEISLEGSKPGKAQALKITLGSETFLQSENYDRSEYY